MSAISRDIYNKMNASNIFNIERPPKETSNIKPIKIELKKEYKPAKPKKKKNIYK